MENNKKKVGGGGGGSSPVNFDHLFGPKDSSSPSSFFGSIFPPFSTVGERDSRKQDVGICRSHGAAPGTYKGESNYGGISNTNSCTGTSHYPNETVEPSYYSSSIYYGGQENYSPRTGTSRTTESHHIGIIRRVWPFRLWDLCASAAMTKVVNAEAHGKVFAPTSAAIHGNIRK